MESEEHLKGVFGTASVCMALGGCSGMVLVTLPCSDMLVSDWTGCISGHYDMRRVLASTLRVYHPFKVHFFTNEEQCLFSSGI